MAGRSSAGARNCGRSARFSRVPRAGRHCCSRAIRGSGSRRCGGRGPGGSARTIASSTARPAQAETRIVFATVGDLFAPCARASAPAALPFQRRALETALLLRESEGSPPEARALGLAVQSVVRTLALERPLLLALDDVQWLDSSSAAVLCFALRRLEDAPVGVLATVRGRPVETPLELDRDLASLRGSRSNRSPWERSIGCSGVASRSTCRARCSAGARDDGRESVLRTRARPRPGRRHDPRGQRGRRASGEPALARVAATGEAAGAGPGDTRRRRRTCDPSVTLLTPLSAYGVNDIELAQSHGLLELNGDRIRLHASIARTGLLRGDAVASKASAPPTARGPRPRSRGAGPSSGNRRRRA